MFTGVGGAAGVAALAASGALLSTAGSIAQQKIDNDRVDWKQATNAGYLGMATGAAGGLLVPLATAAGAATVPTLAATTAGRPLAPGAAPLIGAGAPGRLPWQFWSDYQHVTVAGREYADIGGGLYTRHAVDRMTPSGFGTSAGGDYGRSIAPTYVEEILSSPYSKHTPSVGPRGEPRIATENGSLRVITEGGTVVTVMRTE